MATVKITFEADHSETRPGPLDTLLQSLETDLKGIGYQGTLTTDWQQHGAAAAEPPPTPAPEPTSEPVAGEAVIINLADVEPTKGPGAAPKKKAPAKKKAATAKKKAPAKKK